MDKQLVAARRSKEQIAARFSANQPVTVKDMAIHFGIAYGVMLKESKTPGFPFSLGSQVFPRDYELWRHQRLGLASVGQSRVHPEVPISDKSC